MSASSRIAHDVDEAMSESSWIALAKGKERDWWSIDLEGEVEKIEERGPWSGIEGGSMDLKGEADHKSDRTKVARVEKDKLKEDEMEVDVDASQGESVETKSSKKKVVRVESEETQNYVCGMLATSGEEAEESAFVPSAISEPRGAIYFFDNRCSEQAIRYWQFASVVVEEGGEGHAINL